MGKARSKLRCWVCGRFPRFLVRGPCCPACRLLLDSLQANGRTTKVEREARACCAEHQERIAGHARRVEADLAGLGGRERRDEL
jgi:hypothetical protein